MKKRKWGMIVGVTCIVGQASFYLPHVMADSPLSTNSQTSQPFVTVKDIDMKWLDYNTTFFIGAEIEIEAYIKDDPFNHNIIWALNHEGIIDLEAKGHKAKLIALKEGIVEIAAIVSDGSDSRIHRNIIVSHYPSDIQSQRYLSPGIQPILKVGIIDPVTQVEVVKNQTNENKIVSLDAYLMKLATMGTLILENYEIAHDVYDYAFIRIQEDTTFKVDIRIHKNDSIYETMKNMLHQLSHYNNGDSFVEKPSEEDNGNELPQEPEEETEQKNELPLPGMPEGDSTESEHNTSGQTQDKNPTLKNPYDEYFENVNGLITMDKSSTGTEEKPYQLKVEESLSTIDKIQIMKDFWEELNRRYHLSFMRIRESSRYAIFTFKLSTGTVLMNDFYIEIFVGKDDKDYYETIIHMLHPSSSQNKGENKEDISLERKEFLSVNPSFYGVNGIVNKENVTEETTAIPFVKQEGFPSYYEWQPISYVASNVQRDKRKRGASSMIILIGLPIVILMNVRRKKKREDTSV